MSNMKQLCHETGANHFNVLQCLVSISIDDAKCGSSLFIRRTSHSVMFILVYVDFGLHFRSYDSLPLFDFSDADWGSDPDDRRYTTGSCVYLGRNLVSWSFKKQPVVALPP
ncbi:putative mitochondrial protein [Senna tora]|uniref:Putative mitochondrial protein n=1 Tax=Senna tora TaxID=362788 RepID=A0A834T3C0_9FABA|nr:putative mitochondrial protein [Senna tora]